jgi:hypothetical protein
MHSLLRWPSRHCTGVITRRFHLSGSLFTTSLRGVSDTGFSAACDTRSRAMSV